MGTIKGWGDYWSSLWDNGTKIASLTDFSYFLAMVILIPALCTTIYLSIIYKADWKYSAVLAVVIITFNAMKVSKYLNIDYGSKKVEFHSKDGDGNGAN